MVPVVYLIYRSYYLYLGRMEDEKKHAEEMAALHLRTIEALALAIEAKDHTTHDHLQRVQVYAMEMGKELGLDRDAAGSAARRRAAARHRQAGGAGTHHLEAGQADPRRIREDEDPSGGGRRDSGARAFPVSGDADRPLAPREMGRHGYPDGLKGEEIPIGARILAAVDCLDALASDRQYRRALPLDEAMSKVVAESGISFDPQVVDILQRRYVELEAMAQAQQVETAKLSTDVKIERGLEPAAGFEKHQASASQHRTSRSTS